MVKMNENIGVYQYILEQTKGIKNGDGEQAKIIAEDIIQHCSGNFVTIYATLRRLVKRGFIKSEKQLIQRFKEGHKIRFRQEYFWVE